MRGLAGASLQTRLLALAAGVLLLVWLLAAAWTWRDARHELDELLDGHLAQAAALLVAQQTGLDDDDDDDEVADAPSLHKYAPRVAFQVFHEGRLIQRSAQAGQAPMSSRTRGFDTVQLKDGSVWRVFAARGAEHDIQVYVGERIVARDDILRAVLRGLLLPLVLALPALGLALWWAVRQGLRPLQGISEALAHRQPQALQPLDEAGLPAEIRPLVKALNDLFERIARLMEAERRFTADAAHELRTPIAAIRAQAQVALGAGDDADERRRALLATLAGCDRATHLVEQMLQLARLEQAAPSGAVTALQGVARQVAAELAPQALAAQQALTLEAEQPCPVPGDAGLWRVLLRNLLDNALRYTPPGGRITITLRCEADRVEVVIEDSGPGLDEVQRARLGERFFRALGSEQPGSGLGWSIVRRVAQVLDVQVDVDQSAVLGGLRVRLQCRPGPAAAV